MGRPRTPHCQIALYRGMTLPDAHRAQWWVGPETAAEKWNCAHCHGNDARGDEGPDLYDLRKSDERIHRQIIDGVKGEMPSFAKKLNDSDVRALTAYLRTLHS